MSKINKAGPFLKWAGGKTKLIKKINELFPKSFNNYFEPFLGGGAVFFHLNPVNAYLSDANEELINSYINIRDNPEEVIKFLKIYKGNMIKARSENKDEEYYYHVRDIEKPNMQSIERKAARTIFLNKTCYNGLYRINNSGKFNVPYGRTAGGKLPELVDDITIKACSKTLQSKDIQIKDYAKILNLVKKNDFVYLDPPYHAPNKASMYSKTIFDEQNHDKVAEFFRKISEKGAFAMLNNSSTLKELISKSDNIRNLFENNEYNVEVIDSKWSIGAKSEWREKKGELVVTNF